MVIFTTHPLIQKEVEEAIRNLKLKKSPGFDCVTNEMLKYTNSHGRYLSTMLLNKVLKYGIFPCEWEQWNEKANK